MRHTLSGEPSLPHVHALRRLLLVAACLLATLAAVSAHPLSGPASAAGTHPAPVGSDPFTPRKVYRGDFPDPTLVHAGGLWYAYSTTIAGLNLPIMTSRDLVHWTAKAKNGRRGVWRNDGMRRAAWWAASRRTGKRWFSTTWAPSVARIDGKWVLAYATPLAVDPTRLCLSVATSARPGGPFVDRTPGPLVCPPDRGAIDPQLFVDAAGVPRLLWKTEQKPGLPAQIWTQQLAPGGVNLAPGSTPTMLLQTQDAWEGYLVENPSMSVVNGRYYLFYSAGDYGGAQYATGYAFCDGPTGPCTRASSGPLLASDAVSSGTGGAMSFFDTAGRLRLAYAAWQTGNTGYPTTTACRRTPLGCAQRRLHVATLAVNPDATLVVTDRG